MHFSSKLLYPVVSSLLLKLFIAFLILDIPFFALECLFESFLIDFKFWSKLSILLYILPTVFLNFLVHIIFIAIIPIIFMVIKQNQYFIIPITGSSICVDCNIFSHVSILLLPGTIKYQAYKKL